MSVAHPGIEGQYLCDFFFFLIFLNFLFANWTVSAALGPVCVVRVRAWVCVVDYNRDLVSSHDRTIHPLVLDQHYINLKNQVIKAERRILKELGFCVHVKHPHKVGPIAVFSLLRPFVTLHLNIWFNI